MADEHLQNYSELVKYPAIKTPHQKPEQFDNKLKRASDSIPEAITYLLMRERFDQIYHKIERISSKDELVTKSDKRAPQSDHRVIHNHEPFTPPEICKIKTSLLHPRKSHGRQKEDSESKNLSIGTVEEQRESLKTMKAAAFQTNPYVQLQLLRNSRYRRKILEPLRRSKMSNNIRDYLSVEKISIREMEESIVEKSKELSVVKVSNLLGGTQNIEDSPLSQEIHVRKIRPLNSPCCSPEKTIKVMDSIHVRYESVKNRIIKFKPPFELYYFIDFIWKIGYSNHYLVAFPEEYDTKIKVFIGPGNNSNLIKGILKRRPWYTQTDKIAEASFIWTQIKFSSIFASQAVGQRMKAAPKDSSQKNQIHSGLLKRDDCCRLLNSFEEEKLRQYRSKNLQKERKMKPNMNTRNKILQLSEVPISTVRSQIKIHNHLANNYIIGNKKALFRTMSDYYTSTAEDVFSNLPLTFHVRNGLEDDEYLKFLQHFYSITKQNKSEPQGKSPNKFNAWIIKPGENTNRGNGIIVCLDLNQIKTILKKKEKHPDGSYKTYILQKYIEKPLLYKKRKFDLRHYMMMNCSNGIIKGYWYREGYVRTTSAEYTLKFSSGSVHLTNDAVQKHLPDYGKFEKGNKISYDDLNTYLQKSNPTFDFWKIVYPRMKKIATDTIRASAQNIDPQRKRNNFEVFGLDFMIDEGYNVWLIEVNTNPCLETTCPVLAKIIPRMIESTFQICLDPLFVPPLSYTPKFPEYLENTSQLNNFELVFDERIDQVSPAGDLIELPDDEEDVFEDDGEDFAD